MSCPPVRRAAGAARRAPFARFALAAVSLSLLPCACGTFHDWQLIETAPMPKGELFDAIEYIALKNGYRPEAGACDRGLGTWQSRWRRSHMWVGRPIRYRLVVKVDVDNPNPDGGWLVEYAVERQKVSDPSRSSDPREEDWSSDGQESEAEYLFGTSLQLRLTGKIDGLQITPMEQNRR